LSGGGGPEQRAHERREAELPVNVRDARNRVLGTIRFDTRDLSLGGAFLRSDLLFEVGEELELEFQVPGGPQVKACGKVVHVAREPNGDGSACAGMGIAFCNLSERDREAVRAYLARA
jgi:Tfp pilus assembly protein PilZ